MSKSTMHGCNKTVALSVLNPKNNYYSTIIIEIHNCTDVCRNLANSEMGVTELCNLICQLLTSADYKEVYVVVE